jgi:hypothetical protein
MKRNYLIIFVLVAVISIFFLLRNRENYAINQIQLDGGWNISGSDSSLLTFGNSATDKKVNFNNSLNVNGGITASTLSVGSINAGEINIGNWKINTDNNSLVFNDTRNPTIVFKLDTGNNVEKYPSIQVVNKGGVDGLLAFNVTGYQGDPLGLSFQIVGEDGSSYACGGFENCN